MKFIFQAQIVLDDREDKLVKMNIIKFKLFNSRQLLTQGIDLTYS